MGRRAWLAGSVAALVVTGIAACSDLSGLSASEAPDASTPDADTLDVLATDGAGDGDAGCDEITIDEPFVTSIGDWNAQGSIAPPHIVTTDAGGGAVLVDQTKQSKATLFHPNVVPLHGFDVSFDIEVTCPADGGGCGDGLAFAWVEAPSPPPVSVSYQGHALGLPAALPGSAIGMDLVQLMTIGDPDPPAIEVIQLDPAKQPATYPWVAKSWTGTELQGTHTVSVRLRERILHVAFDGSDLGDALVEPIGRGIIGFTSGTGGYVATTIVRNFHAKFYACLP